MTFERKKKINKTIDGLTRIASWYVGTGREHVLAAIPLLSDYLTLGRQADKALDALLLGTEEAGVCRTISEVRPEPEETDR